MNEPWQPARLFVAALCSSALSAACVGTHSPSEPVAPPPSHSSQPPVRRVAGCLVEPDPTDPDYQYVSRPGQHWRLHIGQGASLDCAGDHSTIAFPDLGVATVVFEVGPQQPGERGSSAARLATVATGYAAGARKKDPGLALVEHEELELGDEPRDAHCMHMAHARRRTVRLACVTMQETPEGVSVYHITDWTLDREEFEAEREAVWNALYAAATTWQLRP